MDTNKQKALVRKPAAAHKQQGEAPTLAPKVSPIVAQKRKNNARDDRPSKKGMGPSVGDHQQKSPSPPSSPRHGVGKSLMTRKGPIISNPVQRLVTHKDYAVEMTNSIIKETDLDPCGKHSQRTWGLLVSTTCPGYVSVTYSTL